MDRFGGGVAGGGQPETPIAVVFHIDAESAHQVERDVDIGLGNQLALHFDFVCLAGERQRHQKGGEELAGHIAAHGDAALAARLPPTDVHRRTTLPAAAEVGVPLGGGLPFAISPLNA